MNILCIGDVISQQGTEYAFKKVRAIKKEYNVDFVIANGENSAVGNGMTKDSCEYLFDCGIDVITGGNHSFRRKEVYEYLDTNENVLRPFNYPKCQVGKGYYIYDMGKYNICVINLLGRINLSNVDCPFTAADKILDKIESKFIIVDFHAETTSEKIAMGHYLSGRASCVYGTHTHVQTSDETIINGTGYITDLGMSGPIDSILGVEKNIIINNYLNSMPARFSVPDGPCKMEGIVVSLNDKTGFCENIIRIRV